MATFIRTFPILLCTALFLATLGFQSGCSRENAKPQAAPAQKRISATEAFETYFGPAPTTAKGTCYGFVIYFPSSAHPPKVVPFPFFGFDEASLKRVALERLVGGMDVKSYRGEFLHPFPNGARLLSLKEEGGTVSVEFSPGVQPTPPLENAVALTLLQFRGVRGVRILSGGIELYSTGKQPGPDASAVLQPPAPRLIGVVGMRETATAPVGEVDALFDRPVNIAEFAFSRPDGSRIDGVVFHSMFDMAAVLKPKEPAQLVPGAPIRVRWKVTDKVGRDSAGDSVLPLEVKVHRD